MTVSYERTKKYLIRGIDVESEIVKDDCTESGRGIIIRSSCASVRWGTRAQDHSYACPVAWSEFDSSFEQVRRQAAETLVRTELGEQPEKGIPLLVVELSGPAGKRMTPACAVNLSFSPTLLSPEFIQILELEPSGEQFCELNNGKVNHIPLYRGHIKFGEVSVETSFLPATYNGPVVLGGDFFQKALGGKEGLITELIMPDHFRTLMDAARCKKKYVLILGSYGNKRERLGQIKAYLTNAGLVGLILDEYPDIEEQSLTEKMVTYASVSRFVIVDDHAPSGHIKELDVCHDLKFITAVIREGGRPSTAMQADIGDEVSYIKEFQYHSEPEFEQVVSHALAWAEKAVLDRSRNLNLKYSAWRSPTKIMG